MEFNQWAPIAVQIPVVVCFIIYTNWMLKAFLSHLDKLNDHYAGLMQLERQQRLESMQASIREMTQICESMEKLAIAISENTKILVAHNSDAIQRHHALIESIRSNK